MSGNLSPTPGHWREEYACGFAEIDAQHRSLFAAVEGLLQACVENRRDDLLLSRFEALEQGVREHFASEEAIQAQFGYPQAESHRRLHDEFLRRIMFVKAEAVAPGAARIAILRAGVEITDWLAYHLLNADKSVFDYIAAQRP
jgi:hemerythrin